jgi:hypothetical protein
MVTRTCRTKYTVLAIKACKTKQDSTSEPNRLVERTAGGQNMVTRACRTKYIGD